MIRMLFDTNLLRRICHPSSHADVREWYRGWLDYGLAGGEVEIAISAVADYELRRGYLYKLGHSDDSRKSLHQLDELCAVLEVQPITERNLHDAARLWGEAKRGGYSTAPERDVDWDVLVAAQAIEIPSVVVTSNQKHFSRYGVQARDWHEIHLPEDHVGA